MKPHYPQLQKGVKRKKRNHKVKCLKCLQVFLSANLKTNRICHKCKQLSDWRDAEQDLSLEKNCDQETHNCAECDGSA